MKICPVILSGGSGTRLWPLSREHYPKQLLALFGEQSLLQQTASRLNGLNQAVSPLLVCNEEHRFLIAEQLHAIDISPENIILEPVGRNTAPALTLAALYLDRGHEECIMLVMPADHVITKNAAFHEAVKAGAALANKDQIITFGIKPTTPETGYGYIRKGEGNDVAAFVEKPDLETAKRYLASQEYFWNSGMFMMKPSVWLEEIKRYQPDIFQACEQAFNNAVSDGDFLRVDKSQFSSCPSNSIDYAVMEKTEHAAILPMDIGWSDIGAWSSLWEISKQDSCGNVIQGDVYTHETKNTLLVSRHRFLAGVGLEDIIIVETADAVLVMHKDHAQNVKEIVARLKYDKRPEHLTHRRVYRPWGWYESIDAGDRFQVKRISVNPGAALSLQMHHHRAEHWVVVRGTARVTRGDDVFTLTENESTFIPIGEKHRLENPGTIPLEIIEVQSGSYLGEDDIVRFEDLYNRNKN